MSAKSEKVTVVVYVLHEEEDENEQERVFVLNSIKTTQSKAWLAFSLFSEVYPTHCDISTKEDLFGKCYHIEWRDEEFAIDKEIDEETGIARWEQTAMALHIAEKYYADDVLHSVDCIQETA